MIAAEEKVVETSKPAEWQTEALRMSAFTRPAAEFEESNWWESIVGESPETRTSQPKVGVLQEEGQVQNGKLILLKQRARIDWLYNALEPGGTIDSIDASLSVFVPRIFRWFEMAPLMQRIAFGAVLHLPADGREDGYRKLSTFLHHVKIDPEGSSELTYQINRPRISRTGIDGLRINRITKWTVGATVTYTFVGGALASQDADEAQQEFFVRLELDINTAQEFKGDLPADRIRSVFSELVDLAREIASEGDIP